MMNSKWLQAEMVVLRQHLKPNTYQFVEIDTEHPYLLVDAMTNSSHMNTRKIMLEDFPHQVPPICMMNPLKNITGKKLCKPYGGMLVLGEHDGHTQKCHYGYFYGKRTCPYTRFL